MVEISSGLYICEPLKTLTNEANISLLLDIPVKKKVLSKHKTHLIFKTFEKEQDLFKLLTETE